MFRIKIIQKLVSKSSTSPQKMLFINGSLILEALVLTKTFESLKMTGLLRAAVRIVKPTENQGLKNFIRISAFMPLHDTDKHKLAPENKDKKRTTYQWFQN